MNNTIDFLRAKAWLPVLALGLLSACGGGGDDGVRPVSATADVTTQVPTAAAVEPNAATAYVAALADQPADKTEVLEPVMVPDALATDDTAEPT